MVDKSRTKSLVEAHTGRDLAEHLRDLYVARRYTDQEIAKLLSDLIGPPAIARSTVVSWRREYGIDRTDRKAALA